MQMELSWLSNTQSHRYNIIDSRPIIIGRKKDCDIVLGDKTVSRHHAELFMNNGMFHLHNLSQTNIIAIYVKQKLAPGETALIKAGYVLQFGLKQVRIRTIEKSSNWMSFKLSTQDQTYNFHELEPITIGRLETCDVTLDNKTVSRKHAEIFLKDGEFYIRNLSQTSSIFVYAQQILAKGQTTAIKSGYAFKVGSTQIRTQGMQSITEEKMSELAQLYKIKCHGCQRKISANLKDCPWCGVSLACGVTAS